MQKVSWCVAATMLSVDQQFRLRYSQLAVAGSVSEIDFIISFFFYGAIMQPLRPLQQTMAE